jgi:hypothetical protein
MKHLKQFESFGGEPYFAINSGEFDPDDKTELFLANEVTKISEILKELGYDLELLSIFYSPTLNLNKVDRIKGKKTPPIAKGDKYYKDEIVIVKNEDDYYDVYIAKITEIPEQTRSERLNGHKAIPIHFYVSKCEPIHTHAHTHAHTRTYTHTHAHTLI